MSTLANKYDFLVVLEAINSNPNGDPDRGNAPRQDIETGHGIITDVCLKRKIRDYIVSQKDGETGYDIYIQSDDTLNSKDAKALAAASGKTRKDDPDLASELQNFMCDSYYDIRAFGAVLTGFSKTGLNGQVKGPVQFSFGRSVDPVVPQEITISRCAVATEAEKESHDHTLGNKFVVPYGLYVFKGHISADQAEKTGFSEADKDLLFEAIQNLWDADLSSARGDITLKKLIVFEHDCKHGNTPSHKLFDRVTIKRKDKSVPARSFEDYEFSVDDKDLPKGVKVSVME